MNISSVGCLVRPARHTATKNAFRLPARSVTRLQRGRPFVQPSPVLWTLGSSRSFSWNPYGWFGKSQPVTQPPAPEPPAASHSVPEETVTASAPVPSQPLEDGSSLTLSEVSAPADASATNALSDAVSDVATNLVTSPAPMKYGDMAALGLVSWTPAGITVWLLEAVQVSTGLPWWNVVILTTIGARIVLIPLVIGAQRLQARIAPLQEKIAQFREESLKAKAAGDLFGAQQAITKQRMLFQKHDIHPMKQISMSLGQIVVQFGLFLGVRKMCLAPVEQLKTGGFGWMMDLTAADPYYILPTVNFVLINLQMSLSKRDILATGSPNALHMLNAMRFLTIIGVPFMAFLPAALNLNIVTSVAFIAMQTAIFRIPAVRRILKLPTLPPIPKGKSASLKDTFISVKEWYNRKVIEGQRKVEERERKIRMAQRQRPRL